MYGGFVELPPEVICKQCEPCIWKWNTILLLLFFAARYSHHEMNLPERYATHHYEPPFQTVPTAAQNSAEHWVAHQNGTAGPLATNGGPHHHPSSFGTLHGIRESHLSHLSPIPGALQRQHGGDSKPVIQAAVLAGYSGVFLKWQTIPFCCKWKCLLGGQSSFGLCDSPYPCCRWLLTSYC